MSNAKHGQPRRRNAVRGKQLATARTLGLASLVALTASAALPALGIARNVYVTNRDANSVSVIDTATNNVTKTIPVGVAPLGIVVRGHGDRAYVVNSGSDSVSVIDTDPSSPTHNTVTKTIDVDDPRYPGAFDSLDGIAISPNDHGVFVVASGSDKIFAISTGLDTVLDNNPPHEFPPESDPHGIAITPDGDSAYVTSLGDNSVRAIALGSNYVSPEAIPVGDGPRYPAITPNGSRLYVPNYDSDSVTVVSPEPYGPDFGEVIATLSLDSGTSPQMAAVTPDGSAVWITENGTRSAASVYVPNNAFGPSVASPGSPLGIAMAASGHFYVAYPQENLVRQFDATTGSVAGPAISVGGGPRFIAVTPNQGPAAAFTARAGAAGTATTFDATASYDSDGRVVRYDWDFGDGTEARDGGPTPCHVYAKAGRYIASLTVTDNEGASTEKVFTGQMTIQNGSSQARTIGLVTVGSAGGGDPCTQSQPQPHLGSRSAATIEARFENLKPAKRSGRKRSSSSKGAKRPTRRTVGYGKGTVLRGRIRGEGGEPLAGVSLALEARPDVASGRWSRVATMRTDASGNFVARVAPGPSRKLRVAYEGNRDYEPASSPELTLRVRGRIAARLGGPKRVRPGQKMRILGRLRTDGVERIPPNLLVVRQRESRPLLGRSHWVTVPGKVRIDDRGRFRWELRLRPQFKTRRLALQVLSRPDPATWPYLRTHSKAMRIVALPGPLVKP